MNSEHFGVERDGAVEVFALEQIHHHAAFAVVLHHVVGRRQAALEVEREGLNAAVDEYNALLEELEGLNAEAAELNRAINVDAEPLPPSQGSDDDLAD